MLRLWICTGLVIASVVGLAPGEAHGYYYHPGSTGYVPYQAQYVANQQVALWQAQVAYQQQLAYQQALYQQQVAYRQLYQQQLYQQQLAQQQLALRQQLYYQQQAALRQQQLAQQCRVVQVAARPLTTEERRQQAISKLLGAVTVKVVGRLAEEADDPLVGILVPLAADRMSNALFEQALAELFPDLPKQGVRAGARLARLCVEGRLTKVNFLAETAKDELLELLKEADPQLTGATEMAQFLVELGQAVSRRTGRGASR